MWFHLSFKGETHVLRSERISEVSSFGEATSTKKKL